MKDKASHEEQVIIPPQGETTHKGHDVADITIEGKKLELLYIHSPEHDVGQDLPSTASQQEESPQALTQREPIQSETNMIAMLKLLQENVYKLKQDTDKISPLAIWDFAGQYAFYTTHQTFLTRRAIYLLVSDVSKQLTDLVADECYFDSDGIMKCKVHELIEVWLNFIHSCAASSEATIPPVILVGTHVDKISQISHHEICEKYFRKIRTYLKDKPTRFHLVDEDFAIDNTIVDSKLQDLKRKIVEVASQQPYWGEQIPARWLLLEQELMRLKAAEIKVIPRSLVEDLSKASAVKISTDELELFLRFQHDVGTILYFSLEILKDKIVLDPQWMIDALKSLITAEMFVLRSIPAVADKWTAFKKSGKLFPELIDALWTKEKYPDFHDNKAHILLLMEQMNIIAKPKSWSEDSLETKEENYFLAPCMLQQKTPEEVICPKPNDQMESSPVLCYVFTGKFLPSPIFHRLIAACIAHWPIATKKKEAVQENLIFCGCCVFELDQNHKLILYFREYIIFLRVTKMGIKVKTPSSKLCMGVREFITTNLNNIIGYLGQSLKFEYCIQCPESSGVSIDSLIPVALLKDNAEVHCDLHDHMIESCKVLGFWFEDQEQSGDGDACHKVPEVQESYEIKQSVIETLPEIGQGIVDEEKSGEKAGMLSAVPVIGDSEEMLPVLNFTVKDILEAWQAVEDYLLEELSPKELLTFFEMIDLLSAEECEDMRQMKRKQVAETLLQKIKTKLPEAFSSFLNVLNETEQDVILQGLRQKIEGTHDPQTITHEQETNAMVAYIVCYTLKMELFKDGNIMHKTESEIRACFDTGCILFDYNMKSQCLMCETGSILVHLKPLCKITEKGMRYFFYRNGIKNFVSDLLRRKCIFSSLPEGEMTIRVEVYCDDKDSQFQGTDGQCTDYGPLNLQNRFIVTDDPQIIKRNLSLRYDDLVEEIDPWYFKNTFVTREILDKTFFEELKSLKRRARAEHFLERIMDEGNKAIGAFIFALRNDEHDDLANDLCTVKESASLFEDESLVDNTLTIDVEYSATHAQESMLYSCQLTATVERNEDGAEGQKRRLKDDQDGAALKRRQQGAEGQKRRLKDDQAGAELKRRQQGAHIHMDTNSFLREIPIEAKIKHNQLCITLDGLFTEDSFENIKQISHSYLGPKTVEKVTNMKQLWSALVAKQEIDVGKYETLIKIIKYAGVEIGIDDIQATARVIADMM